VGVAWLSFLAGAYIAGQEIFPYQQLRSAYLTYRAIKTSFTQEPAIMILRSTQISADKVSGHRWTANDPVDTRPPVLVYGGLYQFLDICPDMGCLAVAFDHHGQVIQFWPYRPDDIFASNLVPGQFPREQIRFHPVENAFPVGIERYENGDLLVNFQMVGAIFPYGLGVARISESGEPVWMRQDYSNAWSHLADDGTAYVPSVRVLEQDIEIEYPGGGWSNNTLNCASNQPYSDIVQVLDGDGNLIETFDILQMLKDSGFGALLEQTSNPCDPLHLNFVDRVQQASGDGLQEGDLVVSLRNLSRFAIVDPKTRRVKKLVGGSFVQQHAVQHLSGAKIILFDNKGSDQGAGPSRVVEIDLETGQERTIFPTADTPERYRKLFSSAAGHIDLAADGSTMLVSYTYEGKGLEIAVDDGRVLSTYAHLHDLGSSSAELTEAQRGKAHWMYNYGMVYLH